MTSSKYSAQLSALISRGSLLPTREREHWWWMFCPSRVRWGAEYRHQCILELAKPQNKDVGVWECGRGGEDRVVRRTGYSDQGNIAVRPPFKYDIFAGEDTALLKQMSAGNSTSFSTVFAFTVPGRGYTNSSLCMFSKKTIQATTPLQKKGMERKGGNNGIW